MTSINGVQVVIVRQKTLGHAHRDIGKARFLDEFAHFFLSPRIGSALAQDDERLLRQFEHVERTVNRLWRWKLCWRRIDHLDQGLRTFCRLHSLPEKARWQIEVDPARPP
jgi:hypothetical protein